MSNRTWPKVAVIGAGAVGSYFGGMLARAGANVTLIGRKWHVDPIQRDGLRLQSGDVEERIAIAATEDASAVNAASLVLFCVKSSATEGAARQMAPKLAPEAIILSMQNGVDNAERIRRHVSGHTVLPVLVYVAAQIPAPGCVKHTGGGSLVIGRSRAGGQTDADEHVLREIAAVFGAAGIRMKISEDIEIELWTKLVMNCAYNAISALSGAPYGRMVAMPEIRDVMRDAVTEVVQVARAKGIVLPETIVDAAIKLADGMPQTVSSTAQDIRAGKRTEIDHLNGYVVREGKAAGIPTPVNATLNALMKLLEQIRFGPRD